MSEETIDTSVALAARASQIGPSRRFASFQALNATNQVQRSSSNKINLEIANSGSELLAYFPEPAQVSLPFLLFYSRSSSKPTHETFYGLAYVNESGRTGFTHRPFVFPTGTMLVREKLRALNGNPERLVLMIKHELDFNPRANGWEFLTVSGDGAKVMKREKNGACLKCHQSASNNDFVFPEDGRYR